MQLLTVLPPCIITGIYIFFSLFATVRLTGMSSFHILTLPLAAGYYLLFRRYRDVDSGQSGFGNECGSTNIDAISTSGEAISASGEAISASGEAISTSGEAISTSGEAISTSATENKLYNVSGSIKITTAIISTAFTLCTLAADRVRIAGDLNNKGFLLAAFAGTAAGLFCIFYVCIFLFLQWGKSKDNIKQVNNIQQTGNIQQVNTIKQTGNKKILLLLFAVIVISRLPWLILNAPGIMTVDSLNQYGQLAGYLPYSNHHPFIHTLMIGLCMRLGGIMTYSLLQIIVCALIHTYGAATLMRMGVSGSFLAAYTGFYAFIPFNGQYAITMWKDIPFSAMVTLFTTVLIRLYDDRFQKDLITYVLFGVSALGMCLFRSNGFVAFLAVLPFCIAILKGSRRTVGVIGAIIIAAVIIITGPVYSSLKLLRADRVEALSIPIQMAARVFADGESVDPDDRQAFDRFVDTGRIPGEYEDFCSDHMKNLIREGDPDYLSRNMRQVAVLWLRFGIRHPLSYMRGFIDATKGFYYPDIPNIIGADHSIAPNEYGLSSTAPFDNPVTIKIEELAVKLPGLLPFYGLLYSPGFYLWLCLLLMGLSNIRRGSSSLLIFLPNLAVFATLMLATPVNNEFRYIYSLVLATPLYIGFVFTERREK